MLLFDAGTMMNPEGEKVDILGPTAHRHALLFNGHGGFVPSSEIYF